MLGLLNINKPQGLTSRQVVNRVQRLVHPHKAGHAGTLDPLATGVLIVCVGAATRLVQYIQRMPKRYTGTFLLGRSSDTEDVEGTVVQLAAPPRPSREQLEEAARHLVGEIHQRPPAFSALKIQGRRAHDLARRGEQLELAPRKVTVHAIRLVAYQYPELQLDVTCGSGTYVRSLGRDLAESLGTAAVMSALVRSAIGPFRLEEACPLQQLTSQSIARHLQPARRAVAGLPSVQLTEEEARRVRTGAAIARRLPAAAGEIAACDRSGRLVAILQPRGPGRWGPACTLPAD